MGGFLSEHGEGSASFMGKFLCEDSKGSASTCMGRFLCEHGKGSASYRSNDVSYGAPLRRKRV